MHENTVSHSPWRMWARTNPPHMKSYSMSKPLISVFTKPWTEPLQMMADKVAALGLDGVELPVRPGYQVTPENAAAGLKDATRVLGASGLKSPVSQARRTRLSSPHVATAAYRLSALWRRLISRSAMSGRSRITVASSTHCFRSLTGTGSTIGVQNHYGNFVGSAVGLLHLIEKYEPTPRLCGARHGPLRGRWRADRDGSRYPQGEAPSSSQLQKRLSRAGQWARG